MTLDFLTSLPEIVLLTAASTVLVVDLFLPDARRAVSYWLTQAGLLATLLVLLATAQIEVTSGFRGMVVADMVGATLKFFAIVSLGLMLFYARRYLESRGLFRGEFFVLVLFSLLGMMVQMSAASFLSLYMGLELMSLSLYSLVALQRDRREPAEAAMKYFVLGALASGLLLYGLSMVYGATGSLDIDTVARVTMTGRANPALLLFGLVFVVSGIAFKLGVVPYHMWVPDVYHGAPTPVTLLIGTAPKLAAFAFTLRVLGGALSGAGADVGGIVGPQWQGMLVVLALLSMILGNVIAIAQANLKRMLAYSTIANMGYMLMGFLAADSTGYSAAMFYAITYVLTSLVAFGVILLLSREGFECDRLEDLAGLNQRSPWWAAIMALAMISLAGLPPTVGFYAKLVVIQAAVNVQLVWLAVAAVLASVVGAFYYLRVVKLMYFDDPADRAPIVARNDARVLLSANGLALLAFGILPQPLLGLCGIALHLSRF